MSQWLPIADIAAKVQAGELKAADLVEQSLKMIADNQDYNAIIATTEAGQDYRRTCRRGRRGRAAGRRAVYR